MRRQLVSSYNEYHNDQATIAGTSLMACDRGIGNILEIGDDLDTVARKAGLDFAINEVPATYAFNNEVRTIPNRKLLVRDDTGDFLGLVSESKYKVRQPAEILGTFREVLSKGDFNITAAGSIQGGKKIWAYAERPGDGFDIKGDFIKPGLIVFESFDGTIATSARFETLRIICNNQLSMARNSNSSKLNRRHSQDWNVAEVMAHLEDFDASFKLYMETMRALTQVKMSEALMRKFFATLLAPQALTNPNVAWYRSGLDLDKEDAKGKPLVSSATKNVIIELEAVAKDGPGADLDTAKGTAFGALQAVTHYQDHLARSHGDKRRESALVGQGNLRKNRAFEIIYELA